MEQVNTLSQESITPETPPKSGTCCSPKTKILLLALGAIGLIVISSLGTFLFIKSQTTQKPSLQEISIVSPTPTALDETANWKTYTNNKYSFSFKYPNGFLLEETTGSDNKNLLNVSITKLDSNNKTDLEYPTMGWGLAKTSLTPEEWIKNKNMCPNFSDKPSCTPIKSGFVKESIEVEQINRQYTGLDTFINKNGVLFDFNMSARKPNSNFSQEERDTYNQILSTFKFLDETVTVSPTPSIAKKLTYSLPSGWKTVQDKSNTFEIGYNPETELVYEPSSIDLNIGLTKTGQYGGSSYYLAIKPYDGGSRHNFILGLGGIQEQDKMTGYHEINYTYNGWSCLVLYGVGISQWPSTEGMCVIDSKRAFAFGMWKDEAATEQIIQTIKLLK
ncbi:MAG: hypothetical protein V1858_01470 [Candidatus Gottesmanbacteria bacterium]